MRHSEMDLSREEVWNGEEGGLFDMNGHRSLLKTCRYHTVTNC